MSSPFHDAPPLRGFDWPPPRRRLPLDPPRSAVAEMPVFCLALTLILGVAGGLALALGGI